MLTTFRLSSSLVISIGMGYIRTAAFNLMKFTP